MIVLEYKIKAKHRQLLCIDDAIRTGQFIRNKALRLWMDKKGVDKYDLNKYSAVVAKEFDFASRLNSTARQSSAERAWSSISRFYHNCKKKVLGKKGYPKFKRTSRSVEYKKSGWKLDNTSKKHITFTDKNNIGRVKLVGSRDIYYYQPEQIKRVRLVRRADGYYCQFSISIDLKEDLKVRNLVRNSKLAKSISDAGWTQFRSWLEYFGWKMGRITIAIPPHFTSQDCPNCNSRVKKSLSTRTHICGCGIPILDRDHVSAIQILKKGLSTVGHTVTYAWGDLPSWAVGAILSSNGESLNQESLTPLG